MNRWIRVVAIAAVVLAAAILVPLFYLDSIATSAIERGGTYALGVDTRLGSARLGLFSGAFRLAELEVDNPAGFEDPRFLVLGEARLDLDVGTLREATVIVPRFAIDRIEVDLDKQRGKANYEVILDNLARFESEDAKPASSEEAAAEKRFVIEEVVIRDVVAHVRVVEAGGAPQVDVVVPEVRMQNVGGEGEPLTAAEVTGVIVKAVLASIAKAGAGLPGGVASALSGGLGRLGSVSVELPEGGKIGASVAGAAGTGAEAVTDAAEAGAEAVKGAGNALEGLGGKLRGGDD